MIRPVKFESQDRRIKQILAVLNENGIASIEEANEICEQYGIDPYKICEETQPICFENAKWAYVVGAAIALKKGCSNAADAAEAIGLGLQAFCIPGSVADDRKVGIVTSLSLLLRVLSRLQPRQTRFVKSLSVVSSTVLARTLHRLSLASTVSHTYRQSSTTSQVS